jgi:hypothetical protein
MNSPTRRPKYINLIVRVMGNEVVLKSGGTTYQIQGDEVLVIPKWYKEAFGAWNPAVGAYVTVTTYGEVLHVSDDILPSELPITVRYTGESAKKFVRIARDVLARYYRGGNVLRLPLSNKLVWKFAVCLTRMSLLQSIKDIV